MWTIPEKHSTGYGVIVISINPLILRSRLEGYKISYEFIPELPELRPVKAVRIPQV